MLVYAEGRTPALQSEAEWMLFQILCPKYPNYPWSVTAEPGVFYINTLDFPTNWYLIHRHRGKIATTSEHKKIVEKMAGEWLERANKRRGDSDLSPIIMVEGVPDKYQGRIIRPSGFAL